MDSLHNFSTSTTTTTSTTTSNMSNMRNDGYYHDDDYYSNQDCSSSSSSSNSSIHRESSSSSRSRNSSSSTKKSCWRWRSSRGMIFSREQTSTLCYVLAVSLALLACLPHPASGQQQLDSSSSSLSGAGGCDTVTKLHAQDLDLKLFQDSKHPSYYRYLTIDLPSNYLFVGAMNRVYGLFLDNIEITSKRLNQQFGPQAESIYSCKINGKSEIFECQNHVRYLVRNLTIPNTFFMCSTGAYSPTAYRLELRDNKFTVLRQNLSGIGFCPFDPDDNATAILVENGNPGGIPSLYAGTYANLIKSDPIFFRPHLINQDGTMYADFVRTVVQRNTWLNEPQYVASFDMGDYVYVFFREVALEYTNCGKKIYSRVARVCKNDLGGHEGLIKNTWLSFVKARLNCSIPGEYPYYFDEIQDVHRSGDRFYGLFTTNINGLTASAICVYDLNHMDRAFNGPFKEQSDQKLIWLPVPEGEVPDPRPGNCEALASMRRDRPLPHKLANFVLRSNMLMDRAVSHTYGKPIFYKSNSLMTKLVGVKNVAGRDEFVFFTSTNTGVINKIAAWPGLTSLDAPKTYHVATYVPFRDQRPIWSLLMHRNWVYFGTDMAVGQISVVNCDKYTKIDLCIYDPHCGWDKMLRGCQPNNEKNLITYDKIELLSYSLEEAIIKQVGQLYSFEKIAKISGSSVTLDVEYLLHIGGTVEWSQGGTPVSGKRHILAKDNALIITDLRKADEGTYEARDESGRIVAQYALVVETNKEQIEQRWMRKFDQWCDEFERYQDDIRQWENKCKSCCPDAALSALPALGGK